MEKRTIQELINYSQMVIGLIKTGNVGLTYVELSFGEIPVIDFTNYAILNQIKFRKMITDNRYRMNVKLDGGNVELTSAKITKELFKDISEVQITEDVKQSDNCLRGADLLNDLGNALKPERSL